MIPQWLYTNWESAIKTRRTLEAHTQKLKDQQDQVPDTYDEIEWDVEEEEEEGGEPQPAPKPVPPETLASLTFPTFTLPRPYTVSEFERHKARRWSRYNDVFIRLVNRARTSRALEYASVSTTDTQPLPLQKRIKYDALDPEFALDEIERRRAIEEERVKQEQERKIKEIMQAPDELVEKNPKRSKDGTSRGPEKKLLEKRRVARFGAILFANDIWDSPFGPNFNPKKKDKSKANQDRVDELNEAWNTCVRLPSNRHPVDVRLPTLLLQQKIEDGIRVSARGENRIVILEYAEPVPIIRNTTGTSSVIVMLVDGGSHKSTIISRDVQTVVQLVLDKPSPLMLTPEAGTGGIKFLHNIRMNAPVIDQPEPSLDFIYFPDQNLLSAVDVQYIVGQIEPLGVVPYPGVFHKDESNHRSTYLAYCLLWKLYQEFRVPYKWFIDRFPRVAVNVLDKIITQYAKFDQSTSGRPKQTIVPKNWTEDPLISDGDTRTYIASQISGLMNDSHANLNTLWQSMDIAVLRLVRDAGISKCVPNNIHEGGMHKLFAAYDIHVRLRRYAYAADLAMRFGKRAFTLNGGEDDPSNVVLERKELVAMRFICRELELAPWNLSYCFEKLFAQAHCDNGKFIPETVMKCDGFGDPGFRGEMVSYLPEYKYIDSVSVDWPKLRTPDGLVIASKYQDLYPPPLSQRRTNPKAVDVVKISGTDKDVRTLSKEQTNNILLALEFPIELLEATKNTDQPITRWDKTWIIQQYASSARVGEFLNGSLNKYDRTIASDKVNSYVKSRFTIERTPEFIEMRAKAMVAYAKLQDSISMNTVKARARSNVAAAATVPTTKASTTKPKSKRTQQTITGPKVSITKLNEMERLDAEAWERERTQAETLKQHTEEIDSQYAKLGEWIAELEKSAVAQKCHKVLKRTIIEKRNNGKEETVRVEFVRLIS